MTAFFVIFGLLLIVGGGLNALREHGDSRENMATLYGALALFGVGLLVAPAFMKRAVTPAEAAVPAAAPDPRGTEREQNALVIDGMGAVQERLKDPRSASFKQQFFSFSGGVRMTCGWVNSKNGFGGYTGFKRYFTNGLSQYTFFESDTSTGEFDVAWSKLCKG